MRLVATLSLLLAACDAADVVSVDHSVGVDAGGLDCPPISVIHGGVALAAGAVVSPTRGLTVDNGIARARYGSHAFHLRNEGAPIESARPFDHVLELRHTDPPEVDGDPSCIHQACHWNGSHLHDVQYTDYGDGSSWSVAGAVGDADRARVLRLDDEAAEVAFEWDHVPLDGLRADGSCLMGRYPECGPTDRDHEGQAVYVHNLADQVKAIASVRLWKTIRVERCSPGYFVSMRSDPPLKWPEQGPRGPRLGYVSSRVVWSCDPSSSQVARHPEAGAHVQFGALDCLADLTSVPDDPHKRWPFVRFLVTRHPTAMRSLQYSATQLGSPGPAELVDHVGSDGRPEAWQAFIGGAEYESPDLALEPTVEARALVEAARPRRWPE